MKPASYTKTLKKQGDGWWKRNFKVNWKLTCLVCISPISPLLKTSNSHPSNLRPTSFPKPTHWCHTPINLNSIFVGYRYHLLGEKSYSSWNSPSVKNRNYMHYSEDQGTLLLLSYYSSNRLWHCKSVFNFILYNIKHEVWPIFSQYFQFKNFNGWERYWQKNYRECLVFYT